MVGYLRQKITTYFQMTNFFPMIRFKKSVAILFLCFFFHLIAFGQLTFRLTSIPADTPEGDNIYVAGNFNGWNAGSSDYILTEVSDGILEYTFSPNPGLLEYKFTRGSWETVEGNNTGGYLPNRTYNYTGGEVTLELSIATWEGQSGGSSSAADNVEIIDDFYMPQLDRNRRIWLYLPPDYENTTKSYPVLYMHDGQNVFDQATSAFGEWEVDESLNALFEEGDDGVIVVAIDNDNLERLNEYSPWVNPQYGGGDGDDYIDFIVETLKPYIDDNYRTLDGREHTGIMGSSMGGLISLYGAIEHQDVFSKAGVFSASFWFSNQCYSHVSNTGKEEEMKIYLIAGALEGSGGGQVTDMYAMYNTLLNAGFSETEVVAIDHPNGQHSEWYWAREFPDAYEWLYSNEVMSDMDQTLELSGRAIKIYPNPAKNIIQIDKTYIQGEVSYEVLGLSGQTMVNKQPLIGDTISLEPLQDGTYLLMLYQEEQLISSQKIHKL
jgi:predicted alpha/beta superfamily hydrolase